MRGGQRPFRLEPIASAGRGIPTPRGAMNSRQAFSVIQSTDLDPRECLLVVPLLHRVGLTWLELTYLTNSHGAGPRDWCGRLLHRAPARRRAPAPAPAGNW